MASAPPSTAGVWIPSAVSYPMPREFQAALERPFLSMRKQNEIVNVMRWVFLVGSVLLALYMLGFLVILVAADLRMPMGSMISIFVSFLYQFVMVIAVTVGAVYLPRFLGKRQRRLEADMRAGIYHQVVGDVFAVPKRGTVALQLNGLPVDLSFEKLYMQRLAFDDRAFPVQGATLRYAPNSGHLFEILAPSGDPVYRDPALMSPMR